MTDKEIASVLAKTTSDLRDETARAFDSFYSRPLYALGNSESISTPEKLTIAAVCRRPELRPLLRDVRFSVEDIGRFPFVVCSNYGVKINRAIVSESIPAAFHFYHCLELRTLQRCFDNAKKNFNVLVTALAAMHSAIRYFDELIEVEQRSVWLALNPWIRDLITEVRQDNAHEVSSERSISAIAANVDEILPLQERAQARQNFTRKELNDAIEQTVTLLPLLYPTARILSMGGDSRLVLNPHTGLNAYGCSPRPRPWAITFSSCTASSISEFAFQNADWLRQDLLTHARDGNLFERSALEHEQVRAEINELFELSSVPGTAVMLASSGTDAELHALYFAIGRSRKPIKNILISSTEIGSGTVLAAGGRHFDEYTPLGSKVLKGGLIDGFQFNDIDVSIVELRNKDGKLHIQNEVDSTTKRLVEEALAEGQRVLIHLLDCSKTGISGPSFSLVRELKRAHPEAIEIIVDAAQTRIANYSLHQFLEAGSMVIISASKFFAGPPFAGALLVPPNLATQLQQSAPLPSGLSDYSTPQEFPSSWQGITSSLLPTNNYGLLLRWRAALWEMRAFSSVSPEERAQTITKFGLQVVDMIARNPDVELVMAPPPQRNCPGSKTLWDQLPSIFTFLVIRLDQDNRRPLNYEEARVAYQLINMDATHLLPIQAFDREYELMRKRCHIGQPVRLPNDSGEWIGGLRIAAGARLVSGVQFDEALGQTPDERLATEIRTAGVIFSKLSVILKYWNHLTRHELPDAIDFVSSQYQF